MGCREDRLKKEIKLLLLTMNLTVNDEKNETC